MSQLLKDFLFKTVRVDYYAMEYFMGLNCVLAIIFTYILKEKKENISMRTILTSLFCFVIFAPIVEESLFRHTLIDATKHLSYYVELNVILFGLIHLTNYFIDKNIYKSIITAVLAFYPGYYFVMLNNVYKGMVIHALYNAIILTITCILKFFIQNNDKDGYVYRFPDCYYVYHSSLRRSKSNTDLNISGYGISNFTSISKESLPLEIVESIDKYDNIIDTWRNNRCIVETFKQ